jgi:hypothetical protein
MITAVRDHLNLRWRDLCPGQPLLEGGIVLALSRDPSARATLIMFDEAGLPAAIVKVARRASEEPLLAAEEGVLRRLHSLGAPAVDGHVPRPLLLEKIVGRLALVTSALPGEPMITQYYRPGHLADPPQVAADFGVSGQWLSRFQRDTLSGSEELSPHTFGRWVESVFSRFAREIGWGPMEAGLLEAIRERGAALAGCRVPLTAVHGDYWMGNLLIDRGVVSGVVDWERARISWPPLEDVYKFPTSYGFYMDRAFGRKKGIPGHRPSEDALGHWRRFGSWRNLAGFRYAYFGHGSFPELVRDFVLTHLARLGVPPAANAVFFPVFLAEQAMALPDPEFRSGYRSLLHAFYQERDATWLWHEEVAA